MANADKMLSEKFVCSKCNQRGAHVEGGNDTLAQPLPEAATL